MKPKIYTYFDKDPTLHGFDTVLEIWNQRWSLAGWEPVVLTEKDAQKHVNFEAANAKIESFPTVNPKVYERACWLRWLAIEAAGGGLMVDSDVLPVRFTPFVLPNVDQTTILDHGRVPCAVLVVGDSVSQEILNGDHKIGLYNGQPHYSDMIMFQASSIPMVPMGKALVDPGWETLPLVHLSSDALHRAGYSKATYQLAVDAMLSTATKPKSCYIAGPMTGYHNFNFDAFMRADEALKKMGYDVRNPARHDLESGFNPETDKPTPEQMKIFMDWDVAQVMEVDEVICLRGWQHSRGATAEVALAQWRGIPTLSWPSLTPTERVAK